MPSYFRVWRVFLCYSKVSNACPSFTWKSRMRPRRLDVSQARSRYACREAFCMVYRVDEPGRPLQSIQEVTLPSGTQSLSRKGRDSAETGPV